MFVQCGCAVPGYPFQSPLGQDGDLCMSARIWNHWSQLLGGGGGAGQGHDGECELQRPQTSDAGVETHIGSGTTVLWHFFTDSKPYGAIASKQSTEMYIAMQWHAKQWKRGKSIFPRLLPLLDWSRTHGA